MLGYDRIDVSEGVNVSKTNASKECNICYYWYFLGKRFKYEPYLCNVCHDLMKKAMNFNDVTIASVKGSDYTIHFRYMIKEDAMNMMRNSNLRGKS